MPLLTSIERIGTVVGDRYRVRSVLGRGGMAVVFDAERVSDGLSVALKLPRAELTDGTRAERLAREGGLTAQVQHPHVVTVLDAGRTQDGLPYLVLERLRGEDLAAHLSRTGRLEAGVALRWLFPIAGALATAHRAGVVHRDLKPGNIFLHRDELGEPTPKLLDFGLARLADDDRMTRSGTAVGTPSYMPPEQAAGEAATPATDVWSLSAVLWCCLTGQIPQAASEAPSGGVQPSPSLALVLERGLRPDPSRRFAGMEAWVEALVAAAEADGVPLPVDPDPVGLPAYRSWHRGLLSRSTLSQEVVVRPEPGWPRRVRPLLGVALGLAGLAWYWQPVVWHPDVSRPAATAQELPNTGGVHAPGPSAAERAAAGGDLFSAFEARVQPFEVAAGRSVAAGEALARGVLVGDEGESTGRKNVDRPAPAQTTSAKQEDMAVQNQNAKDAGGRRKSPGAAQGPRHRAQARRAAAAPSPMALTGALDSGMPTAPLRREFGGVPTLRTQW